ncbi:hypothetical protein AM1_3208 [Acaryochloris marina MBIC11017]|uniref:Uncharacterized protein n=1 Tax=Acaryochloris marina (strain MBIC 11017) TaxID=329726 RepID=B0CFQ0_ACAM1|nr:hypothetical protein AM1_3208 [Acaryochloris marina MBIC11017]
MLGAIASNEQTVIQRLAVIIGAGVDTDCSMTAWVIRIKKKQGDTAVVVMSASLSQG